MKRRTVLLCEFVRLGGIALISSWRLVMDREEDQVSYFG